MRPRPRIAATLLVLAVACGGRGVLDPTPRGGDRGGSGEPGPAPTLDGGGAGATGDGSVGNPPDPTCGPLRVADSPGEEGRPTVLFIVDRSRSMGEPLEEPPPPPAPLPELVSRWDLLREALAGEGGGAIQEREENAFFGLVSFSGPVSAVCPTLDDVLPDTAEPSSAIQSLLANLIPAGRTPTAETIEIILRRDELISPVGPTLFVLITDGDPNGCSGGDEVAEEAQERSVAAVRDAFRRGIRTYVIAIGDAVSTDHLQDLANVGSGRSRTERAEYRQALTAASLSSAIRWATAITTSCTVGLSRPAGEELTVTVAGAVIEEGVGYSVSPDRRSLQLDSGLCEAIRAGVDVEVSDESCET